MESVRKDGAAKLHSKMTGTLLTTLKAIDDFSSAPAQSKEFFQYFFSVRKYSYCCNAGMNVACFAGCGV